MTAPDLDPTRIGCVRHVLGARVTVELDREIAGIAPVYRGRLQPVGQIGSLVRIPQGLVDLIATVSLVGIAELSGAQTPSEAVQTGERWLQVQLLGEINRASRQFRRGVGTYPGLDDIVHFATPEDLRAVFPDADAEHVRIGALAAAEEIPVALDASPLVIRHAAIVGSTGAGKTSAVASLLQGFVRGGWDAANIVVIDPHGEYGKALEGSASMRSVLGGDDGTRLRVPHWALPACDILRVFVGPGGGSTQKRFEEFVLEERRKFAAGADWLELDPAAISADSPVPFDLREVWYRLEYENNATYNVKKDLNSVCETDPGDAATLKPPAFEAHAQGSAAPYQGEYFGKHGRIPELLRLGLLDSRLDFFEGRLPADQSADPLVDSVREWIGGEKPISVLNFAGVSAEATEMAIGVVINLLFEVAVRTPPEVQGIGRPSPVLIVLEEAHRYLSESANPLSREAANRIAREGRKYGVGLFLVTQRPSELPDTALAQCGTLISLRLTNSSDQGKIKAALPDNIAGLAEVLPSLRTGEALISGEALVLPARALIDCPDPLPMAEDPSLEAWREDPRLPEVASILAAWRGVAGADDA
jgi:uncharacterized protein DUF87/helicase HerA-like protein